MQIVLLHQPGAKNNRHQAGLFMGKLQAELRLQLRERILGGAHQARIEAIYLLRQAVVDANTKQRPIQRLGQVNIELIGEPLLVAKAHPRAGMKAGNHAQDGLAQPLVLLLPVTQRIRNAQHHKQQRQKSLFVGVGQLRHPALPVAHYLLRHQVFAPLLRPAALNGREER